MPFTIEIAWTVAWALPMYATPSDTTAGNSISPPIGTAQTVRKGGRRRMNAWLCVRVPVAPYIGHWSSGRYKRTVTFRWVVKSAKTVRVP